MKKDKKEYNEMIDDIIVFLMSLVGLCVTYSWCIIKCMDHYNEINAKIPLPLINVKEDSSILGYVQYTLILAVFLIAMYAIYSIIFKMLPFKVRRKKLMLSIITACAVGFLLGDLLIDYTSLVEAVVLGNLIGLFIIVCMNLADDISISQLMS